MNLNILILLSVFWLGNCSLANKTKREMNTGSHKLEADIALINDGNFLAWEGLDSVWTKENLPEAFKPGPCINYRLGGRKLSRCSYPLANQKQPLQCFFDKEGKAVLLRLEDAAATMKANELIEKLGVPESTRVLSGKDKYAPAKQLIFASRGITLYVLGNIKADAASLMAVALYKPTSAENYIRLLGGDETIELQEDKF